MPTASANVMLFHWLSVPDPSGATLFWLSAVAQWPLYGLPVILMGVWLFGARDAREAAVVAGVAGLLSLFVAFLASALIDHPRPFMVGLAANVLDHPADSSFPSDHATLLFAIAAVLLMCPMSRVRWLGAVVASAGLAVGWARVALGVHFPFDILGAAVIGGTVALVVGRCASQPPLAWLTTISEAFRTRVPWRFMPDGGPQSTMAGGNARPAR